jgi:hypothetical protein
MIVIRIEGVSAEPCSYAWYLGDLTLFLWGLIIGVGVALVWGFFRERANG